MTMDDASAGQVLAHIGQAAYRWSIPEDHIAWSPGAARLLSIDDRDMIATGAAFATLLDAADAGTREDEVLKGIGFDGGEGIGYAITYALRPDGFSGRTVWVEDIGRWFTDGGRRAVRAEGVVRVIGEQQARAQRAAFRARHDTETGLPTRAFLLDLLDETIATTQTYGSSAAFLLVAVDDIALINEAYGIGAGDRAMFAVADRIRATMRAGDAIGRFSGGKLAILLMNCEEYEMKIAAQRFLGAVSGAAIVTAEAGFAITVSIGGVPIPLRGSTRQDVIERAQESLDIARGTGRGRFVGFEPSPERAAARRENAALSRQLIEALAERRLRLAFQPVVDIVTRKAEFHEALLRLVQSDGDVISAGYLVPLAERLGLARLFDLAILELVLDALVAHPAAVLSVNVAPETTLAPDWLLMLEAAAAAHPGIGRRLIVEITETSAIRNIEEAGRFVAALHGLGARVAIDDFGAGFTSFRNLSLLAVDIVKIDGSYICDIVDNRDDQIFVRSLAALARDLGIETVAEWVQDEQSAALIAGWGVERIQGRLSGDASLDLPWGEPEGDTASA